MADKMQKRRATAARWIEVNEVLPAGVDGLETDTGLIKTGDGATAWATLPYTSRPPAASLGEMQAGTVNNPRTMSPADIKSAINALAPAQTASTTPFTPAGGLASTTVQGAIDELDTEKAAAGHNHDAAYVPLSHVGAGGTVHAEATTGTSGFMSAADKTKLNGIAASATANPNALETDQAGEIAALTEKAAPVSGDWALIEDSAAGNAKKKVQLGNIPGSGGLSQGQVDARIEALIWQSAGSQPPTPFVRMYIGSGVGSDQRAAVQAELDALAATGGVLLLAGEARIDGALTFPASAPLYLGIIGVGNAKIVSGGTGNFKLIDFSGYGTQRDCVVEIEGLRLVGGVDQFIVGSTKVTLTNGTWAGNVATFTATAHGLSVSNPVIVQNCGTAGYNGDFTVATVPNANTFTVSLTPDPGAWSTSGTVRRACPAKVSVTAASWSTNVVTFTASGHGRSVGDVVAVTGVSPSGYNGDFTVTAVNGTQFSAALTSNPGAYSSGGSVSDFSDSTYRGINLAYLHTVRVRNCIVEATRGFAIAIDKCTDGTVNGCTVLRSCKDAINISNCQFGRAEGNTVHGCGDNAIAAHTGVLTTGTCAIGAITMANGSSAINVTFPSSNNAEAGDVVIFTGSSPVLSYSGSNYVNLKGAWTIVTKPTSTTATLVADYTNTSGQTIGNAATAAFEIGSAAPWRRQGIQITGNICDQAFGIKVLGGPDVIVTGNIIRNCHNYGLYLGAEGNGGEGHLLPRSLVVADNTIEDIVHSGYLGLSGAYNVGILVDYRWKTIESLRIDNNVINCLKQVTLGTTRPSDFKRGYCQPNGGLADEHRFFFADGYKDTIFSGSQPIYQRHGGISIRCRNAADRNALKTGGNRFYGLKLNSVVATAIEAVERYIPVTDGKRHRFSIPTTNTNLEGGSYLGTAANLDLRPYYACGTRVKSGNPTLNGAQFTTKFRPQGASAVFLEQSAAVDFATAAATLDATVNKEFYSSADKAIPNTCRNLVETVPFGYGGSATAIEVYDFELVVKCDTDDCAFDATYGTEAFVTSTNPDEQGFERQNVACRQSYYDGRTAYQRAGIAYDIVGA